MGNSHGDQNHEGSISPSDYQFIKKTKVVPWGELFEMKNLKTGKLYLMQEQYVPDLESFQKAIQDYTRRTSFVHKHLVSFYGWAGDDKIDKFTHMYKICVFFGASF